MTPASPHPLTTPKPLPDRVLRDGWWLVAPQRAAGPAVILPFQPRKPPPK